MKNILFVFVVSLLCSSAFAKQTLDEALALNPNLSAAYEAIKKASGVDCDTKYTSQFSKVTGPEGRVATTYQVACFDPLAENPNQLGQLLITFYGDSADKNSAVGELIGIEFDLWK